MPNCIKSFDCIGFLLLKPVKYRFNFKAQITVYKDYIFEVPTLTNTINLCIKTLYEMILKT